MLVVHRTDGQIPDDAFITLRYAQNLIDGHGWVYNLHHPTANAASAPLYTLVLALLGYIVGDVERASTLLFVFTTAASGFLAFAILRKHSMLLGGLAAICLMIVNPWLLATRGLETSAFICLLLLSVLLLGAGKHAALGFALAAATLVRGDAAVFAAVFLVYLWLQTRRIPGRLLVGAAVAGILWAITALATHIPLIPDTLAAKMAQGRSGLWGRSLYLRGFAAIPKWFGIMDWATVTVLLAGTGLLLVAGLVALRRYLGPFILGVVLLFAAYGLIIRPPTYHWYYGPQLALMALCGAVTIAVVARAAGENVGGSNADEPGSQRYAARRATAASLAVAVFMTGAVTAIGWRDIIRGLGPPSYLETASWIRDNTSDDATVALTEIGIVGWYGKRDMIDFLGLLSKDSVHEIAAHDSVSWLSREEPDYWVLHQPQWPGMEAAASEPWFSLAYRPVWSNGIVVAWKHIRPIDEAKGLLASKIEPAAAKLADQLEVPTSDVMSRKALSALLAFLNSRPELRDTFVHNGMLDTKKLLEWAGGPDTKADPAGAAIQGFSQQYHSMSPKARDGGYEIPATVP